MMPHNFNEIRSIANRLSTRNTHGYRGVWYENGKSYGFDFYMGNSKKVRRHGYKTAEEAARAYDEVVRHHMDKPVVNFPKCDEIGINKNGRASSESCARGHLRSEHGYWYEKRQQFQCRQCNRESVKRYYERKKREER